MFVFQTKVEELIKCEGAKQVNKHQRLEEIVKLLNKKDTIRITEIVDTLHVSDMTARRDLAELEEQGVLTKIHGGARSNSAFHYKEMSHKEKHTQFIEEKRDIAKKAAAIIEEGNTVFLGPGTTVELLAEEISNTNLSVITNCLPVFNILFKKKSEQFKVYLIGGEMRGVTESFAGEMANNMIETMRFSKMFFSANGVKGEDVMTSSHEEAYTQKLAIKNSIEKYLLVDSSKVGKEDFVSFCELRDLTAVIMDSKDEEKAKNIQQYTEVVL